MRRQRFPALDGLRAVGALAVLTTHVGFHSGDALNGPFAGVLSRLDVGVAIFFAISGFLLYRPYAVAWFEHTDPPLTLPYLRNRALRILPALWVAVLLAVLLVPHGDAVTWASYLRQATLTQIYVDSPAADGLTQLWSLATEVAFYLLLPFLARLLTNYERPTRRAVRWRLAVLACFTLLGPIWMAGVNTTEEARAGLWLPGYLGWFAVGMGFALWQVARSSGRLGPSALDTLTTIPGTVWGIAIALLLVASSPIAGPYNLTTPTPGQAFVKSLLYTAIAACVVFPAITPRPKVAAVLGGRVGHVAGDISYGVFCYHLIVLSVVEQVFDIELFKGQFALLFWPTLILSVAVASASYYLMERPIMRRGRRDRTYDVSGVGRDSTAAARPNKIDPWTTPDVTPAPPSGQG
ncbi:peptidoglycan/LPS O-acetylase OafA/YrhL [Kribbella sp. VKM Ac-2527]|uniref:Peptidoglycan/LPS O-acetylase OafA/YrhL n=1 Tax=Kribbella caucasensis TaxID=2512215 RepID=A0A4R6KH93_9ACTN|nr:acyltransferase [Kribbella sp. VKM Ac-2527]TDO50069.1 peptidoglycan/LPS O-acetylase OafA/YrhL [Kribbella sp. VKM Ac-2527]